MNACEYLSQTVNFGGEVSTVGEVITTLRAEGAPERCIGAYVLGLLASRSCALSAPNPENRGTGGVYGN